MFQDEEWRRPIWWTELKVKRSQQSPLIILTASSTTWHEDTFCRSSNRRGTAWKLATNERFQQHGEEGDKGGFVANIMKTNSHLMKIGRWEFAARNVWHNYHYHRPHHMWYLRHTGKVLAGTDDMEMTMGARMALAGVSFFKINHLHCLNSKHIYMLITYNSCWMIWYVCFYQFLGLLVIQA